MYTARLPTRPPATSYLPQSRELSERDAIRWRSLCCDRGACSASVHCEHKAVLIIVYQIDFLLQVLRIKRRSVRTALRRFFCNQGSCAWGVYAYAWIGVIQPGMPGASETPGLLERTYQQSCRTYGYRCS